ncbi:hypothetical protein [Tabrizicola sp.]|uniref:hypothetical protein n=1 Tax=Tabrizicola sp. TaxID=2005166 RepID=UPI002FDEF5BA
MTDTTTNPAATEGQINPSEAGLLSTEGETPAQQPQSDPISDDQLQREAEKRKQDAENERLAKLDMETEDDRAGKPLDATVWGSTGHAIADEALRTLQNIGISTEDAADLLLDAAMSRDPSKVDQKALVAAIGPRRAKAIMEGLAQFSREMRPKDERISNEVYQHTNGPHAFKRLVEQASTKLSQSELQGYFIEMGKGGSAARRAVESLQSIVSGEALQLDRRVHVEQYGTPKPAPTPGAVTGITSKAYLAALDAMHRPGSRLSFEARARREGELNEARRIGRENGLP